MLRAPLSRVPLAALSELQPYQVPVITPIAVTNAGNASKTLGSNVYLLFYGYWKFCAKAQASQAHILQET